MNPTPAPALEIQALVKQYPRFTLGPVDLAVPTGSIYGLIGPNGAGKSTLMDMIFGMGGASSGRLSVLGLDVEKDDIAVKSQAAYAGPELSFAAWGTVGRALRFVRGFRPAWDDELAARLLAQFDLRESERIATLSFGARTKLSLLAALAWRPSLLVLDEPTTGLDAHAKKALFAELLALVQDEARSVFISSHQITDLERFADHIAILHRGQVMAAGPTAELMERFPLMEFEAPAGSPLRETAGLVVLEQDGHRWRGVADSRLVTPASLTAGGAREVRSQPLSLEDLFLSLTR